MDPNNSPDQQTNGKAPDKKVHPSGLHKAKTGSKAYQSNPFLTSVDGLILLLKVNPLSNLLAAVFMILAFIVLFLVPIPLIVVAPALSLILIPLIIVVSVALCGIMLVISAASLNGQTITVSQAFEQALKRVIPLLALSIVSTLLIGIGFLLLIIPGLILLGRASLAGIAFFKENLGPIEALKRSFALTKGHTIEMLGAIFAGGLLGGQGLLLLTTSASPLVGRYKDLVKLSESGAQKPKVHWLNFVLPVLAVLFVGAYIALVVAMGMSSGTYKYNDNPDDLLQPTYQLPPTTDESLTPSDYDSLQSDIDATGQDSPGYQLDVTQ